MPIDELPYKVHTNREPALMLTGTKPLAAFVGDYPQDPGCDAVTERAFEPYVRTGHFVKREHIHSQRGPTGMERKIRRVLYSQPDQQWRIEAYLLLWRVAGKSGWNEGFERMEGSLLGYEDWQNDAHIQMTRGSAKRR